MKRNMVYLTVLTNSTYIRGVKVLKRSLRRVGSQYDLVILIPKSQEKSLRYILEKEVLDDHCSLCVKEDVEVEYPEGVEFKEHYWKNTFNKLCAASCTEYEKIILLDSDMLILRNIDHLFSKPHYSAAAAGHCTNPEWVRLNSGLMVIEPSEKLYYQLLDSIKPAMYRKFRQGNNIGDQDVYYEAYTGWENHKELLLPEIYNCFFNRVRALKKAEKIQLSDIAVIHFCGQIKPWSDGCFTKKNFKRCMSFIKHGYFYEFKVYAECLLLATL